MRQARRTTTVLIMHLFPGNNIRLLLILVPLLFSIWSLDTFTRAGTVELQFGVNRERHALLCGGHVAKRSWDGIWIERQTDKCSEVHVGGGWADAEGYRTNKYLIESDILVKWNPFRRIVLIFYPITLDSHLLSTFTVVFWTRTSCPWVLFRISNFFFNLCFKSCKIMDSYPTVDNNNNSIWAKSRTSHPVKNHRPPKEYQLPERMAEDNWKKNL